MIIKYYEHITKSRQLSDIMDLLTLCGSEFVPPLAARASTTQSNLTPGSSEEQKPVQYFNHICSQPAFLALEKGRVVAFMSLKKDYVCEEIPPEFLPNIYITTLIVHPSFRNRGIANSFYKKLFLKFRGRNVFTRTWSTNWSHTRILSSLKFYEHCRKENDRGPDIDTVYYYHAPTAPGRLQILQQYHLTGNLLFLSMLTFLSVFFVLTWVFTAGGIVHELSIAFATSLIASALCLLSDSMLKYKDSQNDEYINNLKSFGIENLQFHKDELLESILPKCHNEIWITGYRLIMTGKKSFRDALCLACKRNRGLNIRLTAVPPWSRTFELVYGTEDVADNYIKIFTDLYRCAEKYNTQVEIRFTDKPIFNDTYKVDDRFITSPYMHCFDPVKEKITAKDFFSLDINDPHKQLYELISRDYLTIWDECSVKLDFSCFAENFIDREDWGSDREEKNELLRKCCRPVSPFSGPIWSVQKTECAVSASKHERESKPQK